MPDELDQRESALRRIERERNIQEREEAMAEWEAHRAKRRKVEKQEGYIENGLVIGLGTLVVAGILGALATVMSNSK